MEGIGLTMDMLPPVFESPIASTTLSAEAAETTGLWAGLPIAGGGGDNACRTVGSGVITEGTIAVSVGTSGTVFAPMLTPKMDRKLRVHTFCHAVPGQWHAMGVMLSAGGSLRWFHDTLAAETEEEAERQHKDAYELISLGAEGTPIGAEGLLFLPYLTGERTPHTDPQARGALAWAWACDIRSGTWRGRSWRGCVTGCATRWRSCGRCTCQSSRCGPPAAGRAAGSGGRWRATCSGRHW